MLSRTNNVKFSKTITAKKKKYIYISLNYIPSPRQSTCAMLCLLVIPQLFNSTSYYSIVFLEAKNRETALKN